MSDPLTPKCIAEQAGAVIGLELLNSVMRAEDQAAAVRLIRDAVIDIDNPHSAAGFAVIVADVMRRGLMSLPSFDDVAG